MIYLFGASVALLSAHLIAKIPVRVKPGYYRVVFR